MERKLIDVNHLLNEIEKLKMSPWFVLGKDPDHSLHGLYLERKEAVEVVEDLCIKKEPIVPTAVIPVANIHFDDDKLHDMVDEAVSRVTVKYNWHDAKKEQPPEGRHILVTLDNGGGDLEVTEIDFGVVKYLALEEGYSDSMELIEKIVAWMDLPEPWRKEE
jgi:hypothetical protein